MSADIIQFIPRSTKRRASIIPIEITAAETMKDVLGTTTSSAEEKPVRLSDNGE